MPYSPPAWNAADIEFGVGYAPPLYNAADLEFVEANFQSIVVSGIDAGAFGTPVIVPGVVYISSAGAISESAFGAATVFNSLQYLYPTGVASGEVFGADTVYNRTQYLAPSGVSGEAFGTATIYSTTRWIYGDGFEPTQLGSPTVANLNKTLYGDGFTEWAFGLPTVYNNTRFISPPRIDDSAIGSATVVGPRYISSAGAISEAAFGLPNIAGPRTVYPSGPNTAGYGVAEAQYLNRTIHPNGIVWPYGNVSYNAAVLGGSSRYIYPDSLDEQTFFEPIIGFYPLNVIECSGAEWTEFGDLTTDEPPSPPLGTTQNVRTPGIVKGSMGTPRMNPVQLRPSGIAGIAFGATKISNMRRYVMPSGITGIKFGTQFVSNYTRYVNPEGFDESVVWFDFGPIDEDGNRAMVRNAREMLSPSGFDESAFGTASVTTQC